VITKGTTPTTLGHDFTDFGVPFLRVQNIGGGSVTLNQDTLFIDERTHHILERSQVRPGDVLVSIAGTIGRTGVVPDEAPSMNCNQAVAIVRPKEDLHRSFLRHWLESFGAQAQMRGAAVTGTISNLSLTQLGNLNLPFPPFADQRRIAEILDKADALRAKRSNALAQFDSLIHSIFLNMFGDPATNPKEWPIRKIGEVAEIVSGATPRTDNKSYWDGDVNWITPKELSSLESVYIGETERRITWQGLESCAASRLPQGSVLFSSRAPIGHTAICTVPMATNQGFKSFVPRQDVMEPHFLLFWLRLRRSFLEGLGTGATFKELSKAVVARIELCVPPFALQLQFARQVVALERIRSAQREERRQLDALFTSLRHRAFRGEL